MCDDEESKYTCPGCSMKTCRYYCRNAEEIDSIVKMQLPKNKQTSSVKLFSDGLEAAQKLICSHQCCFQTNVFLNAPSPKISNRKLDMWASVIHPCNSQNSQAGDTPTSNGKLVEINVAVGQF